MKNRGQEPTSYKQVLHERSVLRAIVQKMLSCPPEAQSLSRLVSGKLPPLDWTFLKPHLPKSAGVVRLVAQQASHSLSAKRMVEAVMAEGSAVMMAETLFPLIHKMCPAGDSEDGCSSDSGERSNQ